MPQVGRPIAKERAARLRRQGEAALARRYQAMIGSTEQILVEKGNRGHTACFAPIRLESVRFEPAQPGGGAGTFVTALITGVGEGHLIGHLAA
jgi:threonylcarbamoyladenosine tRNA methylthiotransferase MtaB